MVELIAAIVIDLSDQKLYAYNTQQQLTRTVLVSTGKASSPTPTGISQVLRKHRSITMRTRGPVVPNVPWVLCISADGGGVGCCGAAAHRVFGSRGGSAFL